MKYLIDYDGLWKYLELLEKKDFSDHETKGIMIDVHTEDDVERFKMNTPESQIIKYGMPFLLDAIGNDLSIVRLTKRKFKLPTGRLIRAKFDRIIVNNCRELYGTPLNGYWKIPDEFITKIK